MKIHDAKAFSPAGISSFFEICDTDSKGNPISDLERVGARGGGFALQKGVATHARVSEAEAQSIHVLINGRNAPEAKTTETVAETLLARTGEKYEVTVEHEVEVPIGAGFGTSAGGALGTALTMSKALNLNLTYNQIGRIAHVAEVKCRTGLGTVGPLMIGGCVVTIEPGAPGRALLDRIPISEDHTIVVGVYGPILTRTVLSSQERRAAVNKWGGKTLDKILDEPSLGNFLECCCDFAEKTGFMTNRLRRLIKLAKEAGAIGAAQNMVGEAVHALTTSENTGNVVQAFKRVLPQEKILVSQLDLRGARLTG